MEYKNIPGDVGQDPTIIYTMPHCTLCIKDENLFENKHRK